MGKTNGREMASVVRVVRRFLGDVQHVKVRDLPGHIHKEYIGPSNTWVPRMKNRLLEYKEEYIDEGSFVPVKQVMIGVLHVVPRRTAGGAQAPGARGRDEEA